MNIKIDLAELQPSQLYLNRSRLREFIMDGFDAESLNDIPLPVIKSGNELILADRHTEAFLASQQGVTAIQVSCLPEIENLAFYKQAAEWCKAEGITSVSDLGKQIIAGDDFEREWTARAAEAAGGKDGR